jgi:hypothetical protein
MLYPHIKIREFFFLLIIIGDREYCQPIKGPLGPIGLVQP